MTIIRNRIATRPGSPDDVGKAAATSLLSSANLLFLSANRTAPFVDQRRDLQESGKKRASAAVSRSFRQRD
jgi:hypothetical protein